MTSTEEAAREAIDSAQAWLDSHPHHHSARRTDVRRLIKALRAVVESPTVEGDAKLSQNLESPTDEDALLIEGESEEFILSPIGFSYDQAGRLVITYEPSWEDVARRFSRRVSVPPTEDRETLIEGIASAIHFEDNGATPDAEYIAHDEYEAIYWTPARVAFDFLATRLLPVPTEEKKP